MKPAIIKLPVQSIQDMMIDYMRQTGNSLFHAEAFARQEFSEIVETASHNIKALHDAGKLK